MAETFDQSIYNIMETLGEMAIHARNGDVTRVKDLGGIVARELNSHTSGSVIAVNSNDIILSLVEYAQLESELTGR